jgi:hypothetical protein
MMDRLENRKRPPGQAVPFICYFVKKCKLGFGRLETFLGQDMRDRPGEEFGRLTHHF